MVSTVQPSEVAAMVSALPGLCLWTWNCREALTSLRLVRRTDRSDGTLVQAKLAVLDSVTLTSVQAAIVGIVGLLLTFHPNPESTLASRWTISTVLITVSLLITVLAVARKVAGDQTIALAQAAQGATGETGAIGPAGHDATSRQIDNSVRRYMAEHPPGGDDGEP